MPTQDFFNRVATETFGTTKSCKRAGWLLSTGKLLDFGYRDSEVDQRGLEHKDICLIADQMAKEGVYEGENWGCEGAAIRHFEIVAKAIRFGMGNPYGMTRELNLESLDDTSITDAQWQTIEGCACQLHSTEGKIYLELDKQHPDKRWFWQSLTEEVPIAGDCTDAIRQLKRKIPRMRRELLGTH